MQTDIIYVYQLLRDVALPNLQFEHTSRFVILFPENVRLSALYSLGSIIIGILSQAFTKSRGRKNSVRIFPIALKKLYIVAIKYIRSSFNLA